LSPAQGRLKQFHCEMKLIPVFTPAVTLMQQKTEYYASI
jgi:hypothetical protein